MRKWPKVYTYTSEGIYVTVQLSLRSMLCDKSYGVKHCLYKSYKYLMNGESHFISHYWLDCVCASERSERALWFLIIVQLRMSIFVMLNMKF